MRASLPSVWCAGLVYIWLLHLQLQASSSYEGIQVVVLGEYCTYSGSEGCQLKFSGVVGGEEKHRDGGHHVLESCRRLQTIHLGHCEIENDQVRRELLGFLDIIHPA